MGGGVKNGKNYPHVILERLLKDINQGSRKRETSPRKSDEKKK